MVTSFCISAVHIIPFCILLLELRSQISLSFVLKCGRSGDKISDCRESRERDRVDESILLLIFSSLRLPIRYVNELTN